MFMAAVGLAWGQSGAPVMVEDYASDTIAGQVLALSVDDAGRVFAATTARSFGRGTVTAGADPALQAEDRALRSIPHRERSVQQWLATGRLAPLLQQRAPFFDQPGDGPANFLTKYSESIRWLVDPAGDGKIKAAETVAGAFQDPMDGPGSALLALPGGRWLYGCPPNLWRLEDRDQDQRAGERTLISDGFGLRNDPWGADLHALLEAQDGWIYFTMGERGYHLKDGGGIWRRGQGSGAVFRCRADGRDLVRIAHGLRNPTGLAMLPDGRLIVVDQAAPGGRTRLLQAVAGADFGWQAEAAGSSGDGPWFTEGMESARPGQAPDPDRPQWIVPPLAVLDLEASALSALPDGTLLAADRQAGEKGGLVVLTLKETGHGPELSGSRDLWRGGAVMALAGDAMGRYYFADWGPGVDVHSRCRIRRLSWATPLVSPAPDHAVRLLAGLPASLTVRELKGLLEDPSPRVALRARQRLEDLPFQDSLEVLLQVARRSASLPARLHGLHGAGAVARQDPALLNELTVFLGDPAPEIRAAAARILGEGLPGPWLAALRRALGDATSMVRVAAAEAIARSADPDVLPELIAAAAAHGGHDPWLRSALAHAMASAVPAPLIAEAALPHASAPVRLVAVLALRNQRAPELEGFLADPDATVATEAARAIYDHSLRNLFPALCAVLDRPDGLPEAMGRRALAAAWYLGTPEASARCGSLAERENASAGQRLLALELLEAWDQPEGPDPIWRRPVRPMPRWPGLAQAALLRGAEALTHHPDAKLAQRAKSAATKAKPLLSKAAWLARLSDSQASLPERMAAWHSLSLTNELPLEPVRLLTQPVHPPALRAEARAWLMRRDPKSGAALTKEAIDSGTTLEKQLALRTLDRLPGNANGNERYLLELTRQLGDGLVDRGIQVEVLEILERRDIVSRSPWRKANEAWMASLPMKTDPLAGWRMTLSDGDPVAGRLLFETHAEARCQSCHSVGGHGGLAGPDLDGAATRLTPVGLLESLIHPSAKFSPGYEPRPLPGSKGGGVPDRLSAMPPAGTVLTLREIRDLMAWLQTLTEP